MGNIRKEVKEIFTTTDGESFDDQLVAQAHQAGIDCMEVVEAFIVQEHADSKERHRGTLRKLITSWEGFKVSHEAMTTAEKAAPVADAAE